MTRKEENKILNDKIDANNAQYNFDRMNAEISAFLVVIYLNMNT